MTLGAANEIALEFRDVTVTIGDRPILENVSFQLPVGETIVVTGTSGSGKSVLLHTALGFFRPDSGEILVAGRHIESLVEEELLPLRSSTMGLVFQEDALFSGLTVYDNAAFRLVEHDWGEEETDAAVREILEFVGLDHVMDKLPEQLSIGMRRRLEIARALIGWPPVMLLDEPTAGLDPITARRILDLIVHARNVQGISALVVTKELHEIPYLAAADLTAPDGRRRSTRVALLKAGRLVFLGTPSEFDRCTLGDVLEMTHPWGLPDGTLPPNLSEVAPN